MKYIDIVKYLPKHPQIEYDERSLSWIKYVVVHHSATTEGDPWSFARSHIARGFPGIGYDTVITRDGRLWKTNYDRTINWHAGKVNDWSVGICMVGNFNFANNEPTKKQKFALMRALNRYGGAYGVKPPNVLGHREVDGSSTDCPGRNINMEAIRGAYRFLTGYE